MFKTTTQIDSKMVRWTVDTSHPILAAKHQDRLNEGRIFECISVNTNCNTLNRAPAKTLSADQLLTFKQDIIATDELAALVQAIKELLPSFSGTLRWQMAVRNEVKSYPIFTNRRKKDRNYTGRLSL